MAVMDEKRWRALAQAIRREVGRHFPEWTGGTGHDPGVTLVELFAFLAENLLYRSEPAAARKHAAVLAQKSEALLRVNYFAGQLLEAGDFVAEQGYVRGKHRRRNRWLHGAGVVSGLDVSIGRTQGAARVVVAPGFALDPRGEEIEVPRRISLVLPTKGKSLFVLVRYSERLLRPATVVGSGSKTKSWTRVEETFELSLAPAASANAVQLARITRSRGKWVLDPRFRPARARFSRVVP